MFKSLASESVDLAVEVLRSNPLSAEGRVIECCRRHMRWLSGRAPAVRRVSMGCWHRLLLQFPVQVVRIQERTLRPVRKTGRRVREALLNLPPYPPSVRVLLRVQSCFQSLLIQSEVASPAEKAPSCLGRKPSSSAGQERPRIVAQLEGIHARSLLCRSS